MTHKYGTPLGAQKYGSLLMMTSSIQVHYSVMLDDYKLYL